jgi:precorrin-2 methylase
MSLLEADAAAPLDEAGIATVVAEAAARREPLLVLPAPLAEAELERRLADTGNAVIIKLGRHFEKVRRVLRRLGRASEAIYVERASLAAERVLALDAVDAAAVPYFSLLLVRGGEPRS